MAHSAKAVMNSSAPEAHIPAPGLRVEIRDAEWRVKRVDPSSDGGHLLTCEGLSEMVRGRESLFLTRLEKQIRVLDPAKTVLVDDITPNYRASLLYLDTLLRKSPPTDERIHVAQDAAMDHLPFQLDPAIQALGQPRQRILIADSVGLGKTLEAGILVSELIARGRGKRILVLAVKSMLGQFQQEFWNRFTIPLVRLDSAGLQRVRNRIPANHNPFHYFDRSIISIDTLKQDIEYRHYLEKAYWDIIIIDEAHNVAERNSGSQRAKLAKLLATRSDTLIMLSATPHDGKAESFASLMNMLDPTAIANPKDYSSEDFRDKGLVIRRFKADVREQLQASFPDRQIETVRTPASNPEEAAYDLLTQATFHTLDGTGTGAGMLFRTTLEKALFSSPAACLSTLKNRLEKLRKRAANGETTKDIATLEGLQAALSDVDKSSFSKYQRLLKLLAPKGEGSLGWDRSNPDDRLVLFTESLVTLDFLKANLPTDLGLQEGQALFLRGDQPDRELMETVEKFNKRDDSARLLICSDVASEGLNLHHQSHRMIHFDIPWSLMVFQQRNGRIDRYGQKHQPQIRYLLTESRNDKVRGDARVLEVLIQKDEQAQKNIGDPSEFMRVYDIGREEEITAAVIEQVTKSSDDISDIFATFLEGIPEGTNPIANFLPQASPSASFDALVGSTPRIYGNDLAYAEEALRWLAAENPDIQADVANDTLRITAPKDLQARMRYLPAEVWPDNDRFLLTPNKQRLYAELKRCREEDSPWPELQYLWSLHPVMEWLGDRALNAFGRHRAPILRLSNLGPDEHIVLMQGGFPNRRGYILIHDWVAVRMEGQKVVGTEDIHALLNRLKLQPGRLPNAGVEMPTEVLQELLVPAVTKGREVLKAERAQRESECGTRLKDLLSRLEDLKARHFGQLKTSLLTDQPEQFLRKKEEDGRVHIERIFKDHRDWLENTQITEPDPYLLVAAVFTGLRK
jgi:superfamily II DNA or RNA helicase